LAYRRKARNPVIANFMSGKVATTANHHEVEIDGIARDLRHLREFVVTVKGKGKDGADLRVAVRLGRRTISKACPVGQQHNMTDENGKPRIFCEDRYAFSLGLPTLARRMIEHSYFCWESLDQNRAMNYAVIDAPPGAFHTLKDREYQVMFFYLYPADSEAEADVVPTPRSILAHPLSSALRRLDRRD
jgi:hypothetical protein